jgi:amidophosphoribosyltransferase
VQPLYADFAFGGFAVAHNGNLTNAHGLRRELVRRGCLFQSTTDSEVFIHLIAISLYSTVADRLIDALKQVQGAYSLVALHNGALIGARDPLGVRPLVLGRLGGAPARRRAGRAGCWRARPAPSTSSAPSSCATWTRARSSSSTTPACAAVKPFGRSQSRFCVFEYIYFARPDSVVEGTPVYDTRKRIGAELARESGVPADVVVPVPDSGVPAAMGYAAEAASPSNWASSATTTSGRTFIEPTDQIRHLGVKLKHSANRPALEGKRVVLVDDSIVRGTTSRKIVEMVRGAGPRRCTCASPRRPPPTPATTASTRRSARSSWPRSTTWRRWRGSSAWTASPSSRSTACTARSASRRRDMERPGFCDACFTGDYAIPLTDAMGNAADRQLSLLQVSQ